jgi:CPA1 family monovalent cation:H+ antiporter
MARKVALKAGLTALGDDPAAAAERLREEYAEALGRAKQGGDVRETPENLLSRRAIKASRVAISDLRSSGAIGDTAYRRMEEELDWLDLSVGKGSDY